jgi:hypothetical protein
MASVVKFLATNYPENLRSSASQSFFYFRTIWVPQLGQLTWKQGTPA